MRYPVVLFDLDGTLTDNGSGIMNAFRYALGKYGMENLDPALLKKCVGPPLGVSFTSYFGFSKEEAVQAISYYREYYSAGGLFENEVYEGVANLLKTLKEAGCRIYVSSSKPEVFCQKILEHFKLDVYFDSIVGSLLDNTRANKDEVIRETFIRAGINDTNKNQALMIGDRHYDVEGAHSLGLSCVGVLYGYGSQEELIKAGADWIVEEPMDIVSIVLGE